ncbi:MAG: hypothetical protein R3F29_04710 [Planctomycetota bacterium]
MRDPHAQDAEEPQGLAADSHAQAQNPSPQGTFPASPRKSQKALDDREDIPLHVRPVLDYAEIAALGIVPERTLRRLVSTGRVKRAVLRAGRRVRFVVKDLIDELRGTAK